MHFLTYFLIPQLVSAVVINQRDDDRNRAVYFLDSNPSGASIVSLKINHQDGTLSDPLRIPTGGKGLQGLTGTPPAPVTADPLFSQDSVVVSQNYLFTVNSGSNTVSMYFIDKSNPWQPTLLNTVSSLGEFPVSVAYSPKLKRAYVLNGGAIAGVSAFSVDHKKGLTPLGSLNPIPLHQTTPPVGPPGTASDIVFNPSETALFVSIKGFPPTPGFIYAYPISRSGLISSAPIISQPSGLIVDFSISFLGSDDRALITDPAYGASIVNIAHDYSVTVSTKITIPNQSAICWSTYSSRFDTVFILDAGRPNITLVSASTGAVTGHLVESVDGKGSFDSAQDQTYLYSLKASPSVAVADLRGLNSGKTTGKEIQSLDLSALGKRDFWTGLAVYPSS